MRNRGGTASIVASPVLVGAVTVLVVIVGVFLAYNANNGLPFVPTYDLKAELPNGQKLVRGNEVRLGGFRVGVVSDIKPAIREVNGENRAVALVTMKLEQRVEPLGKDTVIGVRPRSALGLKYIDIIPGKSKEGFRAGDTIPLEQSKKQLVEYEDVFSTFDKDMRDDSRTALKGFGDALAGRGMSLNQAIEAFNPFFKSLTPVMRNLSEPDTRLENFFKNIGRASAEVVPVAEVQANLFGKMAKTFDAISACPGCLQQTIEKSPPTLRTAADSFAVQRPFLADFTALSSELRPTVATLHRNLPTINSALETGTPVLRRTVSMNELTGDVFAALEDLAENPVTLLALKDIRTTFLVLRPLMEYVAPYQTVCNNGNAFFTGLAYHMSEDVTGGTSEVVLVRTGTHEQGHNFGASDSERPADVPSNWDPQNSVDTAGDKLHVGHLEPYSPAVDAQGNADCQAGQYGYIDGPSNPEGAKYAPAEIKPGESFADWENRAGGGSHTSTNNDHPGLAGPTFVGQKLGIDSIDDVK
jgi:virulence factor Mce-like protein